MKRMENIMFLKFVKENPKYVDINGNNLLMIAFCNGQIDCLQDILDSELVSDGTIDINHANKKNVRLIDKAMIDCWKNDILIEKIILCPTFDINYIDRENNNILIVVLKSYAKTRYRIAEHLIKNYRKQLCTNQTNRDGHTYLFYLLHQAITYQRRYDANFKTLLFDEIINKNDFDINQPINNDGDTLLTSASSDEHLCTGYHNPYNNSIIMVKRLLEIKECNMNHINKKGYSCFRYLLEKIIKSASTKNWTYYDGYCSMSLLDQIIKIMIDRHDFNLNQPIDSNGNNMIIFLFNQVNAIKFAEYPIVGYIRNMIKCIYKNDKFNLQHFFQCNNDGIANIYYCGVLTQGSMFSKLSQIENAFINRIIHKEHNMTFLLFLIQRNIKPKSICKMLDNPICAVDHIDHKGKSAIFYALDNKNDMIVLKIINHPNFDATQKFDGMTIIEYADQLYNTSLSAYPKLRMFGSTFENQTFKTIKHSKQSNNTSSER